MHALKPPERTPDSILREVKTAAAMLEFLSQPDGREKLQEFVRLMDEWKSFSAQMMAGIELHQASETARETRDAAEEDARQIRSDAQDEAAKARAELAALQEKMLTEVNAKAAGLDERSAIISSQEAGLVSRHEVLLSRERALPAKELELEQATANALAAEKAWEDKLQALQALAGA